MLLNSRNNYSCHVECLMKFIVIQWFKSDPKKYNCLYDRGWKRLNFPSSSTRVVSFIYYDPTLGTLENSYCNATRYSETWDLQQRRNISSRFCFISKNDTFYRALSQEICESSSSAKILEKVYQVSIHLSSKWKIQYRGISYHQCSSGNSQFVL